MNPENRLDPGEQVATRPEPDAQKKLDERNPSGAEEDPKQQADSEPTEGLRGDVAPADDAPSQAACADLGPPPPSTPPEAPRCLECAGWLQAAAATHPGKVRSGNEDRFLLSAWGDSTQTVVAAVFDGMGGHGGGDLAAQIACQALLEHMEQTSFPDAEPDRFEALLQALYNADRDIHWRSGLELGRGSMGTTAVLVVLTPDGGLHLYCGDSRLYQYRDGKAIHQTRDHSIVQLLLDHKKITQEEAATHPLRSQLTTCLGGGGEAGNLVVEPTWNREGIEQAAHLALRPGDVVLLCSDGLCGEIPAEDLDRLVGTYGQDPKVLVEKCIQAALEAGGRDNVTVVALRWGERAESGVPDPTTADQEVGRQTEPEVGQEPNQQAEPEQP